MLHRERIWLRVHVCGSRVTSQKEKEKGMLVWARRDGLAPHIGATDLLVKLDAQAVVQASNNDDLSDTSTCNVLTHCRSLRTFIQVMSLCHRSCQVNICARTCWLNTGENRRKGLLYRWTSLWRPIPLMGLS